MGMEVRMEANSVEQTPTETMPEHVDALLEAARYDDLHDLVSLESVGVPLDSRDSFGRTALHMAAANGHVNIIEYLIDREWILMLLMRRRIHLFIGLASMGILSYEKTPINEAASRGKMGIIDAINEAVAQVELTDIRVS